MANSDNKYLPFLKKEIAIPEALVDILSSDKKILFYGNGNQGVLCEELLVDAMGFQVEAFIRGDQFEENSNRYSALKSYKLSESPYLPDEVAVIIALGQPSSTQVYDELHDRGYSNVFQCENWEPVNYALREIRLKAFLDQHGIILDKDADPLEWNGFKFKNPWKMSERFLSFFLGEFGELVAPHVFKDFSWLRTEGPYCLNEVDIQKGDVVLDFGANIGLFSAAAASVGARVYGFEPVPFIADYFRQTADLYDGQIDVVNCAVTDHTGEIDFYEVEPGFHDIGESSILNRNVGGGEGHFIKKKVPSITVDDFVEKEGLERVDFLKADMEGAERYMLQGARKTLQTYAPKLALCTYHLPDDKEVMTRIIKESNPDYQIAYKWEKLYAYVP